MIRRALDGLDALGVADAEITICVVERFPSRGCERRDLGDSGLVGKSVEPGELDPDALAHQAVLAEILG